VVYKSFCSDASENKVKIEYPDEKVKYRNNGHILPNCRYIDGGPKKKNRINSYTPHNLYPKQKAIPTSGQNSFSFLSLFRLKLFKTYQ